MENTIILPFDDYLKIPKWRIILVLVLSTATENDTNSTERLSLLPTSKRDISECSDRHYISSIDVNHHYISKQR